MMLSNPVVGRDSSILWTEKELEERAQDHAVSKSSTAFPLFFFSYVCFVFVRVISHVSLGWSVGTNAEGIFHRYSILFETLYLDR